MQELPGRYRCPPWAEQETDVLRRLSCLSLNSYSTVRSWTLEFLNVCQMVFSAHSIVILKSGNRVVKEGNWWLIIFDKRIKRKEVDTAENTVRIGYAGELQHYQPGKPEGALWRAQRKIEESASPAVSRDPTGHFTPWRLSSGRGVLRLPGCGWVRSTHGGTSLPVPLIQRSLFLNKGRNVLSERTLLVLWILFQQKHERIMQGKHFPLSFFSKSRVWGEKYVRGIKKCK